MTKSEHKPLKVLLLHAESGVRRPLFYADPPDEDEDAREASAGPPPVGLRARVGARLHRLKLAWKHSESQAARWTRATWDWLQRHTHPDETLLARLRSVRVVEIYHPDALNAGEVEAVWSEFLTRARRRHWPWFLVNLVVAPLTVVLGPLPGPNLIFYWFAYRAVHHGLILRGLRRARTGHVATVLRPTDRLRPEPPHEPEDLAALGVAPGAVGEFLARHGAPPLRQEEAVGPAGGA